LLKAGFTPAPTAPAKKKEYTPQRHNNNNSNSHYNNNNNNNKTNQSYAQNNSNRPFVRPKLAPVTPPPLEVLHQSVRTQCEQCSLMYPDVEKYEHTNRVISVQWLCCRCADEHMISDEFRVTFQSEYSQKGVFRRHYGRTKRPFRS